MRLFGSRRDPARQVLSRHPRHLLIAGQVQALAADYPWTPSVHDRLSTVAQTIEADQDAGAAAGEALFNLLLEVAGDRTGHEAVTRLRAEPAAMALDDLTHGFAQDDGPILDDQIMRVASRVLVALDPASFWPAQFRSADEALNSYQRALTALRRTQGFAARAGAATDAFWQQRIAQQTATVRSARASWRAAAAQAAAAGESPIRPDHAEREATATRDGEQAMDLLARRYGPAAAKQIRAAAVAADDGCTLWSELVHHAAQQSLGAQFETERWQSIAAMQDRQQTT